MSDNLLSGGSSGTVSWDQSLISSNPFEPDVSPSPMMATKPISKNNNNGTISNNNNNNNNNNDNSNDNKKKSGKDDLKMEMNSNESNNNGIDDILGMFAPSNNEENISNIGTSSNVINNNNNNIINNNNNNGNDNPFISFSNNPFANNTNVNNNNDNNNNNNNNKSSNASAKARNAFDFFEPNGGKLLKKKSDDSKCEDYSTESSVVSSQSEDEDSSSSESSNNNKSNNNNKSKNNNNNKNVSSIAPPKRSSRRILKSSGNVMSPKGDKKRHSAPVEEIESVSNKLKSEGLIPERKIGVDPRSPGVGQRIRNEKYYNTKNNSNNKSKSNNNNNKSNNKIELYEVLPELKRGTALLKYGKHGYPHFRQFNLSEDNSSLRWFSSKKKLNQSEIRMKEIHDVITGQHTKEFERIKWTTLTPASFSIIYGDQKRSLNLVAKSVDEMKMWVESLRYLRNEAKKGIDLSKIKSVKVAVDFRDRNRPQSRQHSGNFLRSHETKEKEINVELKNKLISDLRSLRSLFEEIEKEANNEVIQATNEYSSISQILSEIEERIGELDKEVRNTRNTKIAENDVWRTKIDLESLREKIRVLYKNTKNQYKKSKGRRWSVF